MRGVEIILETLKELPSSPGVYKMLDAKGNLLYIGKAKNLKKRVISYTKQDLPLRLQRMVFLTEKLEYILTKTEAEALLLEASLIKKLQPRFNILLKDDKSFPYIKIRVDHDFPQITKYRGKKLEGGKFFGPFASSSDVDRTINILQRIFKLRPCTDAYFATRKRPCLQYQIKRCSGPCTGKINTKDYNDLIKQAENFLSGRNIELQKYLSKKMQEFSDTFDYEKAAEIRDRIKTLSYIQLKAGIAETGVKDADVLVISSTNNHYCVQAFLYRGGQSYGGKAFFPIHTEGSPASEVLSSFIGLFYQTRSIPSEILINIDLDDTQTLREALIQLHNKKTVIHHPKKGIKLKLIEHALRNAEEALNIHLRSASKNEAIMCKVQELFNINGELTRIEVYDNSHIMGKFAVGAMIVATPNGFAKDEYRRFTIKTIGAEVTGGDDYQMLREVMQRRLNRLKQEPERIPGLMIIDGGVGHMNVVKKVMNELNIFLPYVCMAKGVDRNAGREVFHQLDSKPLTLEFNNPIMKYLQVLRDEVHSYAIRSHRKKRTAAIKTSSLDEVAGIGAHRKRALLNYFGSFKSVLDATVEELTVVDGISKSLAKKIYDTFH